MVRSLIIIVSAPSGSGKTTLIKKLIEKMPEMEFLVSYTTRRPREGEADKEDYIFVTKEEFDAKAQKGELLEWEENFGNYYGTSKEHFLEAIENNKDVILSIDVKGAKKIKERYPESIGIFIEPPSAEELARRLQKRNTDKKNDVSIRLKEAEREIASRDEYDYLIVNEDLEKAVAELKSIIETERSNRSQKKDGK